MTADSGGTPRADEQGRAVAQLEAQLSGALRFGRKLNQELFARMRAELKAANKRADKAERKFQRARARARRVEAELAELRGSTSFKVGRAVVAGPAKAKKVLRRPTS